jgi:hypothetical protein
MVGQAAAPGSRFGPALAHIHRSRRAITVRRFGAEGEQVPVHGRASPRKSVRQVFMPGEPHPATGQRAARTVSRPAAEHLGRDVAAGRATSYALG